MAPEKQSDVTRLERARRRQRSFSQRVLRMVPPVMVLALAVLAWQVYVVVRHVPDYVLPSPQQIWRGTLDEHDIVLQNTVPTFEIAVLGFGLALLLGLGLAIAIRYSRIVELALLPILIASQAVPLIALAPILVLALGYGIQPKLVMVCLMCFFPIVVNTVDGFKSVDDELVNLLRTLGAGKLKLFLYVEFPNALPYVFSGAKVGAAFAVVGAVVGEWAGSSEGLGYLINQKGAQFDTAIVFSAMGVLTILGIAMFVTVAVAERLFVPWQRPRTTRRALARSVRRRPNLP